MARFLFLCILSVFNSAYGQYAFITWDNDEPKISLTDCYGNIPDVHLARATYYNKINETGWAFLDIHTSEDASDEKQAFSAGYIEGFLTRDLIWMHWQNILKGYCTNKTELCAKIDQFVDINEQYVSDMISKNSKDAYWYQIKLYYIQMEGVANGYNAATSDGHELLTIRHIFWLNMIGDLSELAFSLTLPTVTFEQLLSTVDHCTGLVKLLPDFTDLYISQVTWNVYQSMLRIQKKYVLRYKLAPGDKKVIPGYEMTMTSYPGLVHSLDDFYVISTGLVSAETTIGNTNKTLYSYIKPVGQLLEHVRVMVANRLATSGKKWVTIFRKHNSGTYNNQWYVVDYKRFEPKTNKTEAVIMPGLLWVVEQLPGYTEAKDLTDLLKESSYFPSYNMPYFPTVFNMSGGQERIRKYGDWFAYDTHPRAKILKLKQSDIYNLDDMFHVMRYNDYLHDPLSRCEECTPPYSACNAVAARNDLNPANGTYPFSALGHRSHGSIDAKITTYNMHKIYEFLSVSSPAYNVSRGISPFRWCEFDLGASVPHIGHPDEWAFAPLIHHWEW